MKILAIETSCDETACAIVENGVTEIVSVVASSKDFHEATGGIVPEIAARKQIEFIAPVLDQTLKKYSKNVDTIDALAVTVGPGLIGSLLVGVEAAKALSIAWSKPLVPVNHLVGHIYGNFVNNKESIEFPALVLVVSGGHTDFILMRNHGAIEYLGGTLDDAAGEAFDKTARLLGLAKYLGGVQLSNLAATCKVNKAIGQLPRPMIDMPNYDVSFSGLKTAVKRLIDKNVYSPEVIACEFETALIDVLAAKITRAIKKYKPVSLLLGGGVSANTALRSRMQLIAKDSSISFNVPPLSLCTDNAVYIASAAYFNYKPKTIENIFAKPSLGVMDEA
ncbi:tRNA (adenosine(37)-N6)-threonylcarbamoyltransferase complex transferase subunit TsaD [candidate division WWE3 bacterium]|uniref:tRNA N6-adenosine threonylcarbamoyltransferase n=1 Tax=candidate division WWE3 bacterium TaxID=2053526 RepID=A0A7X9DJE8_UNCKA|nr:tRNA (adenosine(37)-N6)-threonylcarbamoyltransferase complex transferase subunit TsaD [candidate division WWE3 bacterium]